MQRCDYCSHQVIEYARAVFMGSLFYSEELPDDSQADVSRLDRLE